MALTDISNSFNVLNALIDLKESITNVTSQTGLQDIYQKAKDKSDEANRKMTDLSNKIAKNIDLVGQNKRLLDDMNTANIILNEKRVSIDSDTVNLNKRKSTLDAKESELKNLSTSLDKKKDELNATAADLENKTVIYNQNVSALAEAKQQLEDEKEEMRIRAEKIKTATEGL